MRSFATLFVSSIARGLKNLRGASTSNFTIVFTVYFAAFTLLAGCGGSTGGGVQPIQKTTPVITWPTPSAITYGAALSSTQLDATPTVAGSFVYSPAAGTVLTAGTQTLSVDFHADGHHQLQHCHWQRAVGSEQSSADHHDMADSECHHLWRGALDINVDWWHGIDSGHIRLGTTPSTVPAVGTDSESVTFTPTDAIDYLSVIGSVPVVVNPASPQIKDYTLGGEPYATEDEFSNTFLQTVLTCAGCESGDTISVTVASIPAISGTFVSTLPGTATTYYSSIVFNGGDSEPSLPSAEIQHPGGAYGNQYSVPFLSIGNQSTLELSPTGTAFQIEQTTGQVYTRTISGTIGTFFPTCTSLSCTTSATQIAVDDISGDVAYLYTGEERSITVYTPTGGTVCSVTATGMSYVSGIAAKGGYMVFTDPTENLVGIAKMDCSGYKTVSVAGQPWAVAMSTYGSDLVANILSRDDAGNGVPRLKKISVPSATTEGFVDLTGVPTVTSIRATTPYEGIYQVQAFSLTSTAAVLFMSDSTDGTVLTINTNTSSGANMAITHTVSVPEFPIGIAAQESASSATVWVNYFLGTGEQ